VDDPMPIGGRAAIPLADVSVRASRSSGPGGQHANVTASRVEVSVDVRACGGLSASSAPGSSPGSASA
jgi:ribosome-associated protein